MQTANAYKNYENIQRLDTLHTYAEWKRIERKRKAQHRETAIYYIKQKLIGLAAVGISVASPLLLDGDATISILMLPLGLFLMVTKEKVMMF